MQEDVLISGLIVDKDKYESTKTNKVYYSIIVYVKQLKRSIAINCTPAQWEEFKENMKLDKMCVLKKTFGQNVQYQLY